MSDVRTALLIPYYNSMDSLLVSLSSIDDSEVCDAVIVDDGSERIPVDEEAARAAWVGRGELVVLRQAQNRGIEHALNAGLDWIEAQGYTYVARLDCGDRDRPGRLARQEHYLDTHPDVLLVGGAAAFVDQQGVEQFVFRLPTEHEDIARMMRRNSAFMHPAVMFRVSALQRVGRYPLDTPAAEDYAFFWRFLDAGRVANLPDVLIDYELDPGGISLSKRRTQLDSRLAVQRAHFDGSWQARGGIARTHVLRRLPYGLVFRAKRALRRDAGGSADGNPDRHVAVDPSGTASWRRNGDAWDQLTVALELEGPVPDDAERLAIDFCARGEAIRLVGVAPGEPLPTDAEAVVSMAAPPQPDRGGLPRLFLTDADGRLLDRSPATVAAVRDGRPSIEVQLRDGLGSVLSHGYVSTWRTVAATEAQMRQVLGPLLVRVRPLFPLPPTAPAALTGPTAEEAPALARVGALGFGLGRFAGRMAVRSSSQLRWELAKLPGADPLTELLLSRGAAARQLNWRSAPSVDFWADPFILEDGEETWMFVEEFEFTRSRAVIRLLQVDGDDVVPHSVVLRTEHHLSFPQVYRTPAGWLATVETCGAYNPIYRFDRVGDLWHPSDLPPLPAHLADPVLEFDDAGEITGVVATDARVDPASVVVRYGLIDGHWRRDDRWVRVSIFNGRGGGTMDPIRGLRATQDCAGVYGRAVELLSISGDRPEVVARIDGADVGTSLDGTRMSGLHTLTWTRDGRQVWCDGWRRRWTPLGWYWDAKERGHASHCTG